MSARPRLYLDHAATSFPKPPGVIPAMVDFGTRIGASPGRGASAEALEAGWIVRRCRERLASLFRADDPDRFVFTLNTTDAINLAVHGLVRARKRWAAARGEAFRPVHVVTSALEHNSVLRPLSSLRADGEIEYTVVEVDSQTGRIDARAVLGALRPETALVVLSHASNVTGAIQPVEEIGMHCRERGVLFLLDAAQTVGHLQYDFRVWEPDLAAMSGHKGLLGPHGTGVLYFRLGVKDLIAAMREGGTGSASETEAQPETMPQKYESGTPNAIGIAGLSEGVRNLLDTARGQMLCEHMLARLREGGCRMVGQIEADGSGFHGAAALRRLTLLGPSLASERIGIFSFIHDSISPAELAAILDQHFGIITRAGLHCAARAHRALGYADGSGSLRISFGWNTTISDVDRVVDALGEICGSLE